MPKALVRHRGLLFVERAAEVLRAGGCEPVVVVLGARAAEVRAAATLTGALVVDNPDWASGMGSSVRVGLSALGDCTAVVVLPVDTPGVTPAAVDRLVRLATPSALARATYDDVPGHPVLLGRDHWAEVAELAVGDEGARPYLARQRVQPVPCGDVAVGTDVDRPEELPSQEPDY